jgi:hypothetical protein
LILQFRAIPAPRRLHDAHHRLAAAKGAALRKSSKDAKLTWLAQAIAGLDDKDRKTLFAAGEIIKRLVKK